MRYFITCFLFLRLIFFLIVGLFPIRFGFIFITLFAVKHKHNIRSADNVVVKIICIRNNIFFSLAAPTCRTVFAALSVITLSVTHKYIHYEDKACKEAENCRFCCESTAEKRIEKAVHRCFTQVFVRICKQLKNLYLPVISCR